MTDPTAPEQDDPLAFTPVPTASTRHDGWTAERQHRFIRALAATGVVAAAARAVGKSVTSANKLRARPDAEGFAAAWRIAVTMAGDRVYAQAIDRALNGVETPRFYAGRQVGTVRRYDYRLAFAVLGDRIRESRRLTGTGDEPRPRGPDGRLRKT